MKGSLTVEASYILPFCMVVILILCQLGIYQYNREVLKITGYECILKTMEDANAEKQHISEELQKRTMELITERMIGVEDLKVTVKITMTKISMTLEGVQKMLNSPLSVKVTYERCHPETTLRIARRVMGG